MLCTSLMAKGLFTYKKIITLTYTIKPVSRFSLGLPEIWEFRELFYFFVWRDVKVRYKQTIFGVLWAILQPLMLMLTFSFVFKRALNIPSDGIPYPIFAYSGLMFWNIFSTGLTNAANSLITNSRIVKKIYFPRLIIPTSSVLVSVFDFLMALSVYFVLLVYYQRSVDLLRLVTLLPLALLITVLSTCGMGYLLAALNVKYRDFRYALPFFIQMLLFISPILYPSSVFKGEYTQYAFALNPVAGAVNLSRAIFIDKPIEWNLIAISIVSTIVVFLVGVYFFRKEEAFFADIV